MEATLGQLWNQFLRDNNCHKEYFEARKKIKETYTEDLEMYAGNNRFASFLSGSFIWSDTKEGFTYWHQLNLKWRAQCKQEVSLR